MLQYNLKKKGNPSLYENKEMKRKNVLFMTTEEKQAVEGLLKKVDFKKLRMTTHCEEKGLLNLDGCKMILKRCEIIDINILENNMLRVVIRSKRIFQIKDETTGKYNDCYLKLVVDIKNNTIVTMWANKASEEQYRNAKCKNNYDNSINLLDYIK